MKVDTIRYVGWPRDELRELNSTEYKVEYLPMAIRATKGKTMFLIPWHNIIDVTSIDTDRTPVKEGSALVKPKARRLIVPQ